MIRVAVPLLIGFIALLIFAGWLIATRRAAKRDELAALLFSLKVHEQLVDEVRRIAKENVDVDPSAELILMTIRDFGTKEIA